MSVKSQYFYAQTAFFTLLQKEVLRFKKVMFQTIAAPVLSSILYLVIFGAALQGKIMSETGHSYLEFLVPGLVMMSILQNAFANSSSSFVQSKISGTLVFLLVTPLSHILIAGAYILAATLRGLIVGACVWLCTAFWVSFSFDSLFWIAVFATLGAFIMASLGLVTALWADRYEQMGVIQTFFVMPMTFLSGVFYSCETLPSPWRDLSVLNPLYYLIDGFRGGFLGNFETNPWISCILGMLFCLAFFGLSAWLLKIGYKIKS